jgi:predicted restriction endonuclease
MKINPYADKITYLPDGRWRIRYSPKKGELDNAVNASLFACLKDKEPVIVLEQVEDKMNKQGAKYRIMGLGLIENYDREINVFHVQHVDYSTLELVSKGTNNEVFYESALREITLDRFSPFIAEDKAIYQVMKEKRDQAFKKVVLEQYGYQCAVTGLKYHSENLTEAQAAHIISKSKNGSDDPRNGITLSRTAHWAFDKGIFTISDQYEILVHPKAKNAKINNFPILDMHGIQINLPEDENYYPHPEAIEWHKKEVFNRFDS